MSLVVDRSDRGSDESPASFPVDPLPNGLLDEGAALALTGELVELSEELIVQMNMDPTHNPHDSTQKWA